MLNSVIAPIAALLISGNPVPAADTLPAPAALRSAPVGIMPLALQPSALTGDSAKVMTGAIEHSDLYYTRLTIHRYGSYAMLPLFGAQYYLGNRLLNGPYAGWVKPAHKGVAAGIEGLFVINTVTGLWNLWDARNDPHPRIRYVHAALLLAADAGFAIAPFLTDDDNLSGLRNARIIHRNVAIGSMSLATVGAAIMWFRRDND